MGLRRKRKKILIAVFSSLFLYIIYKRSYENAPVVIMQEPEKCNPLNLNISGHNIFHHGMEPPDACKKHDEVYCLLAVLFDFINFSP